MGANKTSRLDYSCNFMSRMCSAYSYQAKRAIAKASSGFDKDRRWLWFEKITFDFHAKMKNLDLMKEPTLGHTQITEYKGNVECPELQEAIDCSSDWQQAQRKGGLCKQTRNSLCSPPDPLVLTFITF